MLWTNKVVYVCQVSKLQHMYVILLNTFLCAKDDKTHQIISNLNRKFWDKLTLIWVGFLGFLFYPLLITMSSFESGYLASCIYDFSDESLFEQFTAWRSLFVIPENIRKPRVSMGIKGNTGQSWINKRFEVEKKSLYKNKNF